MGAMKSLLVDDDRPDLLKLMGEISNARDEYREELFREREIKHDLLEALKGLLPENNGGGRLTFETCERLRDLISKAGGR